MNNFLSSSFNRLVTTVALVSVIVALGTYAYYTVQQTKYMFSGPVTISVLGEGEVMSKPDIGKFSFSVTESAAESSVAIESSGTKVNAIIAAMKEAGVEEKDIKTVYYNLYPKYKYVNSICSPGAYCPGEQVPDGFEVTQNISVKVRDLDKTGALITLATEKGATNLSNLEFTIDEPNILKEQARAKAIEDAKAKAQVLATELGVRIEKMVDYYENEGNNPTPYYNYSGDSMMKAESVAAFAPEVPVGENITKSQVTITYQVK